MPQPDALHYGKPDEGFYVEYMKRSKPFSMASNHYHAYYEVYYLVSGKREYFIKDSTYTLDAGDLIFIGKNELHKTLQAGQDAHERLILHFGDAFLRSVSVEHSRFLLQPFRQASHHLRLPEPERSAVRVIVERMLDELRERPTAYEVGLKHSAAMLMLAAARHLERGGRVPDADRAPNHRRMLEIVRYLNDSFTQPVSLEELANRYAISPCHLSRTFKKVIGFSLTDYLNLMRVKEAQRLLEESDEKIIEVAAAAGFENFSHFGKTFKRIAGCTPREYRKRVRARAMYD